MKKTNVLRLVRIAAVASIYFVLTVAIAPISYGEIQMRVSEILLFLCFYNKDYCISLTVGCALANLFSPFALIDVPIGSAATLIAVILMSFSPNIFVSAVFPVITNGVLVGLSLTLVYSLAFPIAAASVAIGELAVCVAGALLFRFILEKQPHFMKLIDNKRQLKKQ